MKKRYPGKRRRYKFKSKFPRVKFGKPTTLITRLFKTVAKMLFQYFHF